MSRHTIEQLTPISHNEVKPMYSKEEILDKLATAVQWHRDSKVGSDQRLELELMYSILKSLTE